MGRVLSMTYKDPERRDRPSTSKFSDYFACQAKYRFELECETIEPNEFAAYGNECHAAWSGISDAAAIEHEDIKEVIRKADSQFNQLIEDVSKAVKAEPIEFHFEERLWYGGDIYSGRPDRVVIFGDKDRTALIPDLKSLWGEVEPPAVNWQLRGDVPLAEQALGAQRAVTAIIQPNREWMSPAWYDPKRVEEARMASLKLVREIDVPNPTPTPGEHCGRCNARLTCKASAYLPGQVARIAPKPEALMPLLSDRMVQEIVRYGKIAKKVTEAAEGELKKRIEHAEDPEVFDFYLKNSGEQPHFNSLQAVFSELKDMCAVPDEGKEFDEFLSGYQECLSLSLPKLAKFVYSSLDGSGLPKEEVRETLERRLTQLGLLKLVPKERALTSKSKFKIE
jgi:hypothetical protein